MIFHLQGVTFNPGVRGGRKDLDRKIFIIFIEFTFSIRNEFSIFGFKIRKIFLVFFFKLTGCGWCCVKTADDLDLLGVMPTTSPRIMESTTGSKLKRKRNLC